ncbi:hypothetical protein F511_10506 [Dorcoceras hygrometricum]|uniref:Uncharacterized protein n=1 Tax=Dorcoceras hygrometricum TaxID=472368 RepID=A0A2Z7ACY8_9LAMI|nr:hypothetical protein F511_10506 [Dorcoceras hygrometricum]
MNSRRICPVVGSQYIDSAAGLVFMEWAAGLAMETSKVGSAVQAISRWISVDDVIGDVIIFSRWFEKEQSQESAGSLHPDARGSDVVERQSSRKLLFTSRCYLEIAIAKRCRLHKLIRQRFAIQQKLFALITSRKNQSQDTSWKHMFYTSWTTRRKQQQHPVESYMNQLLLYISSRELQWIQTQATAASSLELIRISRCYASSRCEIQSRATASSRKEIQAQRIVEVAKRSS